MSRPLACAAVAIALTACSTQDPPAPPAASAEPAPVAPTVTSSASAAPPPSASATASASADTVTHASPPPDPGPSVLASGSVDGAALRKRHLERLTTDTSPVTVLRGETALDLGRRLCESVVPKRSPETPVLLKPNLCGFDSIKDPEKHHGDDGVHGRSTDVDFSRGVVQCLKARGHKKITIAEGCGISHKHWEDVTRITGYDVMAREEGVRLMAMDDDGVFDVEGDQPGKPLAINGIGSTRVPTLLLPKVLAEHLDHGLFLSLPKIKAHRYSVVSLAIKGMQGTVMLSDKSPAYKQKWRMHKELNRYLDLRKGKDEDGGTVTPEENRALYVATLKAFAERMVDVLEISTPDAVLADGAPAMGGDGFQQLRPSAEKVAIGGTNPVLVDRVGAAFLGLWNHPTLARELGGHASSPLIEIAGKRYKLDLKSPALTGDGAALLASPRPTHFKAMAPFSIDWDPPGSPPPAPYVFPSAAPAAPAPTVAPSAPAATASPSAAPASASPSTQAAPPPAAPSADGKPEAHAAALGAEALTIDGRADDAAWARARPVAFSTDYAGKPTRITTKARFLWSANGLHVLFEIAAAGFHTDASFPVAVERKKLYEEDCVELFLTPDPAHPKHYYEVEIGPLGHYFDIDVDREHGKQSTAWSSGATIATTRDPAGRTAIIEALLTAPEITSALRAGARLPLGLYRIEGQGDRSYLAWSPPRTAKPNFHVPEAFGTLVLDAP
ncbi:Hypothetical protein A7982_02424 [Minicystis rosea]|nr:Hypothetical protein A7982_02424 [Minicystis rosea]